MKTQTLYLSFYLAVFSLNACQNSSIADKQSLNEIEVIANRTATNNLPYFGASSAGFPEEPISGIESWQRLNNRLKSKNGGSGLKFRRSYGTGMPADFNSSNMADDIGKCTISVGEVKPDFNKSQSQNFNIIRDFVLSIPSDRTVYLVFHHEPEKKIKEGRYTSAQYRSGLVNFIRAVISVQDQRPNVHPCYCLMSWTFNPKSGRNPEDYRPVGLTWNERRKTIAGVDGYCDDPSESASSKFNPIFDKMGTNAGGMSENWGFTRFAIFETSAHGDRSNWITDLGSWAKNRGNMELVSWFNSGVGPNAGLDGWYLGTWGYNQSSDNFWFGDDNSLNAYAQVIK